VFCKITLLFNCTDIILEKPDHCITINLSFPMLIIFGVIFVIKIFSSDFDTIKFLFVLYLLQSIFSISIWYSHELIVFFSILIKKPLSVFLFLITL